MDIKDIIKMVRDNPNDMELGEALRGYVRDEDAKWRVEQFNRNRGVEEQVDSIEEMEKQIKEIFSEPKYVYESPDKGKTVYRRILGDYDNKVQVDRDGNPYSEQMNLFE